ncbi:type I-E CRISPR-associated protein Cas7/Cse4/CasC [Streptomyces uncialis]|uniref:type I-E CRISPR-associated protein Cas7/Cse4/CasC n=1 Tax=Streptomyces uncialis TaxID=1048205 RepID=UPI003868AA2B
MTRTILDIHILQTVPPSNLNRDDTGTPKSAVYGGVRRARVSSQAWKRAVRTAFSELLDTSELGVRTKKVAEVVAARMIALDPSLSRPAAMELAAETMRTATHSKIEVPKRKTKDSESDGSEHAPESAYLMFLSGRQINALAELAVEGGKDGDLKALKEFLKIKENKVRARQSVDTEHSVDIALFGRMVADWTDLNVDAAQVAHALSVHTVEVESDYFTAVDDQNTDAEMGAGMIGSVDFNSATLYRYAAVDVDRLQENLGTGLRDQPSAEPTRRAVAAFLEGFITSLPTGKINTFGHHTLPAAVIVKLRSRRPISFVSAFEKPVTAGEEGGFLQRSCERLAEYVPELESQYGLTGAGQGQSWVLPTPSARDGSGPRVLWRVDRDTPSETLLFIVSPARPDLTHLVDQAGWPAADGPGWNTFAYQQFLSGLTEGDTWGFRLTANPVHHIHHKHSKEGEPTKRAAHQTPFHQMRWLLARQQRAGFEIVQKSAERQLLDRGDEHELIVRDQRPLQFRRPPTRSSGEDVRFAKVTFDGRLRVTDPEVLRRTLTHGLGKAKAYGCGLMTLAPVR